jgi:subtilisin family serine protease
VRKWIAYLLAACLLAGVVPPAAAAEPEEASDGYIICLDEENRASLFPADRDLPDGVEEIYAPEGLYKVTDPDLVAELEESGRLEYAEPDYLVELDDTTTSSDSSYQWSFDLIGMDYAQEMAVTGQTLSGEKIRVGVVDSGLYAQHEAFQNLTVADGANFCVQEGDPEYSDTSDAVGHGTFVTGVIAASLVREGGTLGIAPAVEIVPLKCFDTKQSLVSNIIRAIYAGVDEYHCRVLNMSLGTTATVRNKQELVSLKTAIDYADENGVILVAAGGNLTSSRSTGNDPLQYPAAYDNVISVGAVDSSKTVAAFSCQNTSIFVTAPGAALHSVGTASADAYTDGSGTSYAAPVVTAAAALALSVDPSLTPAEFMALLADTAEDLGTPGRDNAYGYGLLRVDRLLQAMLEGWLVAGDDETGYTLSAWRRSIQGDEDILAAEAAYDASGQLLDLRILATEAPEYGAVTIRNLSVPKIENAATVKILLLQSGTWAPLGPWWEE